MDNKIEKKQDIELRDNIRTFILGNNLIDKVGKDQADYCLQTALAWGLNPLKRQIHFVPFWANGKYEAKIVVGYEVYIARAESTGKLNGWKVELIEKDSKPYKAIVTIYRKDWEHPFTHEAYFDEVKQMKKDKNGVVGLTAQWLKQGRFMLKKVAVVQAFRFVFPEEVGTLGLIQEEQEIEDAVTTPSIKDFKKQQTEDKTDKPKVDEPPREKPKKKEKVEEAEIVKEKEEKIEEAKPTEATETTEENAPLATERQIQMLKIFIDQKRVDLQLIDLDTMTEEKAKEYIKAALSVKPQI